MTARNEPHRDEPGRDERLRLLPGADAAAEDVEPDEDGATRPIPAPPRAPTPGQLRRERRKLWDRRQEGVYHLGGLALELFLRNMIAEEVVRLRATEVAEMDARMTAIDAQLAEIATKRQERRRRGAVPAAPVEVGSCLSCGTPYQAEARFCWRCGARLPVAEEPVADDPASDQATTVIPMDDGPDS